MKESTKNVIITVGLAIFGISMIFYIANDTFFTDHSNEITLRIVGVNNETLNASSLVSIHYECIKICNKMNSESLIKRCWEECAKLGKEQCP